MRLFKPVLITLLFAFVYTSCVSQNIPPLHIKVDNIPADGLVVHTISLSEISKSLQNIKPEDLQPVVSSGGKNMEAQWVPEPDFSTNYQGTIVLQVKDQTSFDGLLTFSIKHQPALKKDITAESSAAK